MNRLLKISLLVFICGLFAFASKNRCAATMEQQESFLHESIVVASPNPVLYDLSSSTQLYNSLQSSPVFQAKNLQRKAPRNLRPQIQKAKLVFSDSFVKEYSNLLALRSRFKNPGYILAVKTVLII